MAGLGFAPFSFEYVWKPPVEDMLKGSFFYTKYIPHPPMIVVLHYLFALAGGLSIEVFRSASVLMGMLTIIVSYFFAKSLYGRKTAVLSALLMSVLFYPLWMSLFVDIDGSVLTFFSMASLFSFHMLERTKHRKWLLAAGIFFGLALLSKYSAVLLLPTLLIYDYFANRLKNLKNILCITLAGILVFSVFPVYSLLLNSPGLITDTLRWGVEGAARADSSNVLNAYALSIARLLIFIFQYGTPIICLVPLYLLLPKQRGKNNYILLFYAGVILFFFTFITTGGLKARYIMPAVPALVILASSSIVINFKKVGWRDARWLALLFVVFFTVIMGLNMYGVQETLTSKNIKLDLLLQNSMFWYSGHASTPFAIHMHSLIFLISLSIILFLLSLRFGKNFILALVVLGLSFNFFIVAQSFYPTAGPNFTASASEMLEYYKTSGINCTRLYSNEWYFLYYLDGSELLEGKTGEELKGCIFIINVQGNGESKEVQDFISGCEKIKSFYSNGFDFGQIYVCR